MERLQSNRWMLYVAVSLSFLAGYVDALGFLKLGGVFISFMSGNSTRLGVSGTVVDVFPVLMQFGIIALFVGGVIIGSLIGHSMRGKRSLAIMGLVAALLAMSGLSEVLGFTGLAVGMATLAMGAVNTLFEKDGEVSVALTYMTGTLVRMGQRMAAALRGGTAFGWLRYFMLWAGLVCGEAIGACSYNVYGFNAIWFAAALAAAIFLVIAKVDRAA